jgi:peptidyl-dipeptidase Dcp
MTNYQEQGFDGQTVQRPHVSIVCNFTKPTKDKPSLLTFDELQTLFHEFGHALHSLLSQCYYSSLAGTNVLWDFVELPSQIMENWTFEKESLDLFAEHYETGEKIPSEWIEKIKKASQFQAGLSSLKQVTFALIDMAWHHNIEGRNLDPAVLEEEASKDLYLLPRFKDVNFSVSFAHIFAGGYSAGYYSYKWAEVLDADAFEYFKSENIFSKKIADRFRSFILEKGGSDDPAILYKNFRGQDPDPQALFRRSGLLEKK